MGCYKVLSTPMPFVKETYKGLHRVGVPHGSGTNKRYLWLWEKEIEHIESEKMGVTTELTIDELKEYANLAALETGKSYEVIYFSEHKNCPHKSKYYGVDVTGVGGYSMVGEGFFRGSSPVHNVITQYFTEKLNAYGLFSAYEDAVCFREVIIQLGKWLPGSIEDEDWRVLHIYKVL
ncbi:hypothetical protein DW091_19240 [Eubacterium sp. AM05-23]|uniref:hypothetical protein n=1 Tax=Eubacterium TaxID=1730 RepID=UPI000E4DFC19|nr:MULTISPECIES: hypothetical protein [Eubacterium]RHO53575.1 hypothetical protein DW091_19240 [Eubacterium sp. AM05-23]